MSLWTLFGGKGGVGKTTCAASWALARAREGVRVLVVSTDPAHSLADAFNKTLIRGRRTAVAPRLDALELDASGAVTRWLKRRRPELSRLIEQGTLLDRDDVARVLALPLPGLDELAAFLAMVEFERAGGYDEVVVDTAPTGHTLRLLETPRLVERAANVLSAMHDRHAIVAEALGASVGRNHLVDELREDAASVTRRLHDERGTRLFWVTLPEPVAVAETLDAIGWLRAAGLPLSAIVVNRMTHPPVGRDGCGECRARVSYERAALAPLIRSARAVRPPTPIRVVEAQPTEPRGLAALRRIEIGEIGSGGISISATRTCPRWQKLKFHPNQFPTPISVIVPLSVRLLFFGGKGGVGKTTCAAAAGLAIASRYPERTVRLISTDPAPSLGDVLGIEVGDRWTRVSGAGRLDVRELDARKRFDEYRTRYRDAVEAFFDRIRGDSSFDASADRAVFERLFDLAPPGLDEVMALLTVVELLEPAGDDLLIVDTAPTGHTLRLLALQDDAQQWVALLMQLIVKYRLAGRAESLARDLVQVSRGLRTFRELLADSRRSQFVAVVRPAALPRLETSRLLDELRALRIATPLIVVNGETTGTCAACRRRMRGERQELTRLRRLRGRRSRACDIMHAPLHLPPPRGSRDLLAWAAGWEHDGEH